MSTKDIIIMILVPFLFTLAFMPVVMKIARHIGAMDIPNQRKVHKTPIPRLGGLGIYFGFLLGYVLFGQMSLRMNAILIGSIIIIITGIIDDINPIPAKVKLLGQIAAASVVAIYGQILLQDISAFGLYINFSYFSYPITIIFIVAIINGFGLDTILTFIMLGSTLGFLFHNFNPAKIFAGDSGSMFMGYMIAVIALLGFKNVTLTTFLVPLVLIAIPILDTLFAIIRRIVNKKPISEPDKEHLHHQLLKLNLSHRNTVLVIYFIDILFAIASLVYIIGNRIVGIVIYAILFILVFIFVMKTDIIFKHKTSSKIKE